MARFSSKCVTWLWCHRNVTHVIELYRIRKDRGGGVEQLLKKKTDVMSKFPVLPPPWVRLIISFSIAFTEPYSPLFWAYGYITHTSTLYSYLSFPLPAQNSGEKWKYIAITSSRYLLLLTSKLDATFYTNFYFRNADVPCALDHWYAICTQKSGVHLIAW